MKIRNTNKLMTAEQIRQIFDFVRLPGCEKITIKTKNTMHLYAGRACLSRKVLIAKINNNPRLYPAFMRPYQYGQLRGRKYWIGNATEMMVYILAHEARHFWQSAMKNRRGYVWGSRGRYSEIDADSYAIRMLRKWRSA